MSHLAADGRVARGLRAQLALRRERLDAGEEPLGWKLGFGSPAALELLRLEAPLVGFLTRAGLAAPGAAVPVGGWALPVVEPELAVRLRRDVPAGTGPEAAREAIGALGPALELADVDRVPDDVEAILAGNVFHRAVVLGPTRPGPSLAGLEARVFRNGEEAARTDRLEQLTGELGGLVAHVGGLLAAFGERLRAGETVIAGSIVPPLEAAAGEEVRFELAPVGAVSVRLAP